MKVNQLKFKLEGADDKARAGTLTFQRGIEVQTPVFMPVGTRGSIKGLTTHQMEELGFNLILGNTYHLYLRPGHELIEELGGLHGFSTWKRAILTDSGGFQIFSLKDLTKVTEEGVLFQSHLDGSRHLFTPEVSMGVQRALGSDIAMAFDHLPALPASAETLRESLERTLRWAKRCTDTACSDDPAQAFKPHQNLFAILQGGLDLSLRLECLERLQALGPDAFGGFAIGGLSVGEKNEEMVDLLNQFVHRMPTTTPRYLMGVGTPLDVLNGVRAGVDMFDCVLPTRNARNGQALTATGPLNIKNAQFKKDTAPLEENCPCPSCSRYSRAYIRHLITAGELAGVQLMTLHNLSFYKRMMDQARSAILRGQFDQFYRAFYKDYTSSKK